MRREPRLRKKDRKARMRGLREQERLINKTLALIVELSAETTTLATMQAGIGRLRDIEAEWERSGWPLPPEFAPAIRSMNEAIHASVPVGDAA